MGGEIFILAAFGAMLCWGLADFFIQRSVRKIGDVEALGFIGLIGGLFLLPFAWADIGVLFNPDNFWLIVAFGLIDVIVAIGVFESYKRGKLAVVEVVLEFELPVVVFLSIIALGEQVSSLQILLIAPAFVGIVLMAFKKASLKGKKHFLFEKGFFLALISALGLGIVDVGTGLLSRSFSPFIFLWLRWTTVFVVSLLIVAYRRQLGEMVQNAFRFKWIIILMAVFDTLAWVFYAFAMSVHGIGVITAITEAYPVIGLLLGYFVNKEKISLHQYAGAMLTILASIALASTLL